MTILRPHIAPIGVETVELVGQVQLDQWGDPVLDEDGNPVGAEDDQIPGCVVYPRGADEAAFRASTTTDEMVLLAPVYETDIDATRKIRWRGRTYELEGNAMPWLHMSGDHAGVQANLKRTGG